MSQFVRSILGSKFTVIHMICTEQVPSKKDIERSQTSAKIKKWTAMERKGYRTFTDVCEDRKVICDGSQSVYRHMKSQEVQIATLRRENCVKIPMDAGTDLHDRTPRVRFLRRSSMGRSFPSHEAPLENQIAQLFDINNKGSSLLLN